MHEQKLRNNKTISKVLKEGINVLKKFQQLANRKGCDSVNSGGSRQQQTTTSLNDSLLQTVASLLINKTGMEERLEAHQAARVRMIIMHIHAGLGICSFATRPRHSLQ